MDASGKNVDEQEKSTRKERSIWGWGWKVHGD